MPNRVRKIYQLGLRWPKTVLSVCLALTLAAGWAALKLPIENDLVALMPQEFESVQALQELREHFGGLGFLVVAVEAEDAKTAEQFADAFVEEVEKLPAVQYVDYRRPIELFRERRWLYLDLADLREMERRIDRSLELQAKGVSPYFNDLVDFADEENRPDLTFADIGDKYSDRFGMQATTLAKTDDGRFVAFKIKSKAHQQHLDQSRTLIADIKGIEAKLHKQFAYQKIIVKYTGDHVEAIDQVTRIKRRMALVTFAVSALLVLVLVTFFRQFRAVWLISLPLAVGIIWTGGLIYLTLGHLNIITGFAAGILAGLGSDYGIYLLSRFYQERRAGNDFAVACERTFRHTGRATYSAMITTVFAFLALLFSNFGVTIEFGIVGALGLFLNYIAMMLIIPSCLQLIQQRNAQAFTLKTALKRRRTGLWLERCCAPRGTLIGLISAVILVFFSALAIPEQGEVHFEDGRLDAIDSPESALYGKVALLYGGTLQPTVLITRGFHEDRKIVNGLMSKLHRSDREDFPYKNAVGLSTFVTHQVEQKKAMLARIRDKFALSSFPAQPKRDKMIASFDESLRATPIHFEDLPPEVTRLFDSPVTEDVHAVFVFPNYHDITWNWMQDYSNIILGVRSAQGLAFKAVDNPFIATEFVAMIQKAAPKMLLATLGFIFAVLLWVVRPFRRSLLLFTHLVSGLILLCGAMWLWKVPLNTLNIAAFPIVLGTGIDSFIHFSTGFDEFGNIRQTVVEKLPSVLLSNLTSVIGFGGLLFVPSAGLRTLGGVILLGLFIMTGLAAFVLPRALIVTAGRRPLRLKLRKDTSQAA